MKRSNLWNLTIQTLYQFVIGSNLQITLHLQRQLKKIVKRYFMSSATGDNRKIFKFA